MPSANTAEIPMDEHLLSSQLAAAIRELDVKAVEDLLKRGANPNLVVYKLGGLTLNANDKRTEIIRLMIKHKVNVNWKDENGVTALMEAARGGNVDAARLLLDAGAEINAANQNGSTALMYAANYRSLEVFRLLIERGADVDICDPSGRNAFSFATDQCQWEMIVLLEKASALQQQLEIQEATIKSSHDAATQSQLFIAANASVYKINRRPQP